MRTQLTDLTKELKDVRQTIKLCEYEKAEDTYFYKWLKNKEDKILCTIINIQ